MSRLESTASELVVELRRRSGLSQAELARRAGLTRSVVNAYEHGQRQPGVDALARMARACGFELGLAPLPAGDDERAARILEQVLELAQSLPWRPQAQLRYPPLASVLG